MRANFNRWVRKLIGKLGVPYNRRLLVRGSPHPRYYEAGLSLPAADSNAFRIHTDCRFLQAATFAMLYLLDMRLPLVKNSQNAVFISAFHLSAPFYALIIQMS